jgi:hypothetical protein
VFFLFQLIKDGEPAKAMKRIPCVVHEGESYTPGTTVNFGLKIFVVKHVFISNDLMKCSLMVTNVANETDNSYISEEIMLGLDEVVPMQDWELSEQLQTVCKNVASNSYSEVCTCLFNSNFFVVNMILIMLITSSEVIKRWCEAESLTIFENHVYMRKKISYGCTKICSN